MAMAANLAQDSNPGIFLIIAMAFNAIASKMVNNGNDNGNGGGKEWK